jgi:Holliday junction resolvasome RuvABC endonuclease subunit
MGNGKKTKIVGRPALPKGHANARIVPVRFKPEEFKGVTGAAKASKKNISEWIRGTLNAALQVQ